MLLRQEYLMRNSEKVHEVYLYLTVREFELLSLPCVKVMRHVMMKQCCLPVDG